MIARSVRDAMTEDLRSIGASASAVDAAQRMREGDVGSLPVVENERLVGMQPHRGSSPRGSRGSSARATHSRWARSGPHAEAASQSRSSCR